MDEVIEKHKQKIKRYLELENVSVLAGAGTSWHLGAPIIREIPKEILKEDNMDEVIEKHKQKIKRYLELENVSVLAGAGTSWHLGAPIIREIPKEILKNDKNNKIIKNYFKDPTNASLEDLLNCLQADRFINEKQGNNENVIELNKTIYDIQNWLYKNCNSQNTPLKMDEKNDQIILEILQTNRYYYHELFIKKLLQRPNNLKRINLFTVNYDMAFDYALDNLGVHYINGFMGVHNRCFRPEVYNYDLYYPGQSVSGKVYRAEKVIKYYKLHGSLSWLSTAPNTSNSYGISEVPLSDELKLNDNSELIVYPCTNKKSYTLDLPYSELFRQFSHSIIQPQSVLFCIGYSFFDEHINDIIKQALSIPSFTLIIVNYTKDTNKESKFITLLRELNDSRIYLLEQSKEELSTFINFTKNILPDLYEMDEDEMVSNTMAQIFKTVPILKNSINQEKGHES